MCIVLCLQHLFLLLIILMPLVMPYSDYYIVDLIRDKSSRRKLSSLAMLLFAAFHFYQQVCMKHPFSHIHSHLGESFQ